MTQIHKNNSKQQLSQPKQANKLQNQTFSSQCQTVERIRIDKFISHQNQQISRNDVKSFVRNGRVSVNGEIIKNFGMKINPQQDEVFLDGKKINYKKHIYIMLNKPQGVVCSTRDGRSPTVLSLVPDELMRKGLFPAGRLDKDTEGFVLITNDGELAHNMLSPRKHVPKVYYVELKNNIEQNYPAEFEKGIVLKTGEKCLPAKIIIDNENPKVCQVIIREGMFHQVKKMFEAVGNKVVFLKRIQIGGLRLDSNLGVGKCMEILHKNVEKLLEHPYF